MSRRTSLALILALAMLLGLPALVGAYAGPEAWSGVQTELSSIPRLTHLENENLGASMLDLTPTTTATPPVGIQFKFEGVIKSIDDTKDPQVWVIQVWGIGEVTILVPTTTEFDTEHGDAVPGAWVKVKAHFEPAGDGLYAIVADKIEVKRGPDACFKLEFYGELMAIETDPNTEETVWTVSGHEGNAHQVIITGQTTIEGTPVVGAIVKVEGCAQADGTVIAREVKVLRSPGGGGEEVEFRGPIVDISDTQWQVGHWTVIITDTTQITGDPPNVGDLAEVKGVLDDLGQVVAGEIEVKDRGHEQGRVRIEGYITAFSNTKLDIQDIPIQIVTDTIQVGIPPAEGVWASADVIVQQPVSSTQQTGVTYVAVRIRTHRSNKPADALKFTGMLESIDGDTWTVSGWPFVVPADTPIKHGPASPGDWVEIEATYNSGTGTTYTAQEVEVRKKEGGGGEPGHPDVGAKVKGRITALDADTGQWAVEGIPIEVGTHTIIDGRHGEPAVGVWVEVKAMARSGEPYLALAIETSDEPELSEGQLKFEGRLESMDGLWVVAGWSFTVDGDTTVEGTPVVGDRVEVTATWDGATYHADTVKAKRHHHHD